MMPRLMSRRSLMAATVSMAVTMASRAVAHSADAAAALRGIEAKSGGKLGVCILDTSDGQHVGHRINERFGMCSSFKLPLAAVVLNDADHDRLRLDEVIPYTKTDVIERSPVAESRPFLRRLFATRIRLSWLT